MLSYLQKSGLAFNLKDLEKTLPSVASINGMQVKDYLQALSDEGKIRVEKIGSGNWYWSFMSEERRTKEKTLDGLRKERDKVTALVEELRARITHETAARQGGYDEGGDGHDRASLTQAHEALRQEVLALQVELASYAESDPGEVQTRRAETERFRAGAVNFTELIYMCERHYFEATGNSRDDLKVMQQILYGDLYVEDEGLAELWYMA